MAPPQAGAPLASADPFLFAVLEAAKDVVPFAVDDEDASATSSCCCCSAMCARSSACSSA
jgi:hypothetical protein